MGTVTAVPRLRVDAPGLALVIRMADEPQVRWEPWALSLPTEADRVAVLVTPQATASSQLADALLELMSAFLEGTSLGVRVMPLGGTGSAAVIDRWAKALAARAGREIVVPHGRLLLAADGSPTLHSLGGGVAQWAAWRPGAAQAVCEPAVVAAPPRPEASGQLTALAPPVVEPPAVVAPTLIPVILDRAWPGNGRTGQPLPAVSCDLTVTTGGYLVPVAPARRWRSGGSLPKAASARRGRPAALGPVGGPELSGAPDLPGGPTVLGWSFRTGSAGGRDGGSDSGSGGGSGCGVRSMLPVPAGPAPSPAAWFAVEIESRVGLPTIGGRPVAPAGLARQIATCPGWGRRPVLLVSSGATPKPGMVAALCGALADALGVPVIAGHGLIRGDLRGDLDASGGFRGWYPKSVGADRKIVDLGRLLRIRPARTRWPRRPTAALAGPVAGPVAGPEVDPEPQPSEILADLAALLVGAWPVPPVVGPSSDSAGDEDRDPPASSDPPPALPAPAKPAGSSEPALWIGPRTRVPPRPALRTALGQRYDVCGRFATRIVAEQPGLRVGRDRNDLHAALTALRAYCVAERDFVNATLRSCPDAAAAQRVTTLATWMVRGLESCPSTLGPLFRPGRTPTRLLEAYQPGMILVEPGFFDAELEYVPRDGATVEYVFWSLIARRLDRLTDDTDYPMRASVALFPPNSRFEVLAVDRPESGTAQSPDTGQGPGTSRWRVLLRQLLATDTPGGEGAERILRRLRSAIEDAAADESDGAADDSPEAVDPWTFGGDPPPAAIGQGSTRPESTAPPGSVCSSYAPGLDRDGARYDPAAGQSHAPDGANTFPTPGVQR